MNLSEAFRYYRARPVPGHVIHGRKQPSFAGQSYAMPDDGIGAAVWALKKAREAVAALKDAKAHYETCAALKDESPTPENVAAYQAALRAVSKARRYMPSRASLTWQPGKPGFAYVDKPDAFGLRHIGDVEAESCDFSRRDSCGWYTDPHGDVFKDGTGLVWGVVYQLPARKGKARFVAGYQFGGVDGGPMLDLANIFESDSMAYEYVYNVRDHDDARDAARAADSMAQHAAEQEREYQTAWALGNLYAEKAQEVADARKAALALLAERRAVKGKAESPAICAAIRDKVESLVDSIREARDAMRDALSGDGPGLCVYMDSDAKAAFCEAAGLKAFPA